MVWRRKGQLGVMDRKPPALYIEQPARTAEVVQQMAIDMEQIRILAQTRDDMLVPYFGQHGAAGFFQGSPPFDGRFSQLFLRA
jgi:hypothetical protein